MRNILNPRWLILINTIPVIIIFLLFSKDYNVIKSLLTEENIQYWIVFGSVLAVLGILNLLYALILIRKKKNISYIYGIVALILYITYIYLYSRHIEDIIPFNIPQWMISDNIIFYIGSFLMPTLAYSVFILVVHFTPRTEEKSLWKNFLAALSIPTIVYVSTQVITPLWRVIDIDFNFHVFVILIITSTVIFLFLLIRSIYILLSKNNSIKKWNPLIWEIPVTLIFPILGLMLNNGLLFNKSKDLQFIFGDFSNRWFYIIAVINAIAICLPNFDNKIYRVTIFIIRAVTYTYTMYFFIVFLPYLPLSIIAILAFGLGFLMLAPFLLFILHTKKLATDYNYLKTRYDKKLLIGSICLSILIIPAILTFVFKYDKKVLNETLSYVYAPKHDETTIIDKKSLATTLHRVKHNKSSRSFEFTSTTPYISSYLNRIVLDNLSLSENKIEKIEKIFFDSSDIKTADNNTTQKDNVVIINHAVKSVYDASKNQWISTLELKLKNNEVNLFQAEYSNYFSLPKGCYISDYYLYIGNKKEYGILAEKKSAMWVYTQITNEKKDPGILYYLNDNKIGFKVFPFSENETRTTGIEFIHKEPVELFIDNLKIHLGDSTKSYIHSDVVQLKDIVYVSVDKKAQLQTIKRKPYFHFIVDISKSSKGHTEDNITAINKLINTHTELSKNARISFANTYTTTFAWNNNWKNLYKDQLFEGGFFLERAINKTLIESYKINDNSYPVIVVVTDDIKKAIIEKDFSNLKFTYPESDNFYVINRDSLAVHSLTNKPLIANNRINQIEPDTPDVLIYPASDRNAYLSNNNKPDIVLMKDKIELTADDIKEKSWESALLMHAKEMQETLYPDDAVNNWTDNVKYSFLSKTMNQSTSYLVVENEAQKAILNKKQEEVLSGNKLLDINDEVQSMSEPDLIITLAFLLLVVLIKRLYIRYQINYKINK